MIAGGTETSPGTVRPITVATNKPGKPVRAGLSPVAVAVAPDGRTAYVANFDSGTVTPITVAGGKAGKPIKVGKNPTAIALVP